MALNITPEAQLYFYDKIFGKLHPTTVLVGKLISIGTVFEMTPFNLKANWKGNNFSHLMQKGSTSLLKGAVEPAVLHKIKKDITIWVSSIALKAELIKVEDIGGENAPSIPAPAAQPTKVIPDLKVVVVGLQTPSSKLTLIKAIREGTGLSLQEANAVVENLALGLHYVVNKSVPPTHALSLYNVYTTAGGVVKMYYPVSGLEITLSQVMVLEQEFKDQFPPYAAPIKPMPVSSVISLRDAKAVGQKVKGTNEGSIYHCVAVGSRVKVATRVQGTDTLSIRAEWVDATKAELEALKEGGLDIYSNYASTHLNTANAPVSKVVGAFLFGLGIQFEHMIQPGEKLATEGVSV